MGKNIETIEKLLSSLTKKGVILVFFSTPLPGVFSIMINPEILSVNKKILDDLCKKYECKYFSYTNDRRFLKTDFIDVNQLNFIGARKFSRIIDKQIFSENEY